MWTGMFDDYNRSKQDYSQTFGTWNDKKPWEETQLQGPKKVDSMDPAAPPGQYMVKVIPEPLKDATGRSEWYHVREGGTKQYRINKNNVLTDRGVSIVRALEEDKARHEASMLRRHGKGEPLPPKKIKGTFTPYDPPRLELGKTLKAVEVLEGEEKMGVTVRTILDPNTGQWKSPVKGDRSAAKVSPPATTGND